MKRYVFVNLNARRYGMYNLYSAMWNSFIEAVDSAQKDTNFCRKLFFFQYVCPALFENTKRAMLALSV